TVLENQVGQRVDNYLLSRLKGVPKSRIYRIIRKGEVRVNKKRVKPDYKLALHDAVRIPPVRVARSADVGVPSEQLARTVKNAVLYEDEDLLILNKPSGLPVHGGTGVKAGLIEVLRYLHPQQGYLELVHRLDKGTSGCIMVAKNARVLKGLNQQLRERLMDKRYHALVCGQWPLHLQEIRAALYRHAAAGGERMVQVDKDGKAAVTRFRILRRGEDYTLIEAAPETGRTHQIRVHAQLAGHAIAGDEKYNTAESNRQLKRQGVTRLCLHAASLELEHPPGQRLQVRAPCDDRFSAAIDLLL
ncbi:MAG: RluA family pseudouridine synthase, partial [Pseudohongiellaceae bacterium]